MAFKDTTMHRFGTSYDINAINKMAIKAGMKPLTAEQVKTMKPSELKAYLRQAKEALKLNRVNFRRISGQMRKNAKLTTSENFKQAQLMHGTLRQAIGEAGTLGAQAIATSAITRGKSEAPSAITQNTDGGTVEQSTGDTDTEKGPVYSYHGREEE
jgi:hypothetical protein